jgi:DNA-binding cell septation regulator SpoVG
MDPDLLVIFGTLGITGITIGAMSLFGLRMWIKRMPQQDPQNLAESLRQELRESVQDEVAKALEARDRELEEVHERLEFAERLLTQARLPQQTDTDSTPGE